MPLLRSLTNAFSTFKPAKKTSADGVNGHTDIHTQNGGNVNNTTENARTIAGNVGMTVPNFALGDFPVDENRPVKVVVIGAGYSGITAGIRFPQRIKNIDLTIYDKNAGVGGTWYSNRYPGLSCDIPSHTYQFTFEENPEWSSFYAPGPEIRAYLQRVADKYKLERYLKLQHELIGAQYNAEEGKWHLKLRRPAHDSTPDKPLFEELEDVADFVMCAAGGLSRWKWPEIEGLHDFKGKLMHSAAWDTDDWREGAKDWKDKKVGIIGVGSSAIQMVPALQPYVGHMYNFVRGKTWLAVPFLSNKLADMMKRDPHAANYGFSEEDKEKFRDPAFYKEFRRELEGELNSVYSSTLQGTEAEAQARKLFKENMLKRLEKKPWIAEYLMPEFPVACRRLTPGPGYLEALTEDNVDFVPKDIKRVTPTGLETSDGQHYDFDILICATGYDTTYNYPFPIIGRGGKTLQERYTPHPTTYLSICTDGFPNWFNSQGPNSGFGAGSLLIALEREVGYAAMVILKMQRERLKSIEVKKEAVEEFDQYLESYFPKTVFGAKCRSWYKAGKEEGRIVGLWPGSCLQLVRILERPRWEDYNYELLDDVKNRFYWLGDGSTYNDKYLTGDRAWYVSDEELDFPPVPTS